MTKSFDLGMNLPRTSFQAWLQKEVQRILAQHQEVMKERSSISSHMGTGTAADLLSATPKQTIHDDLTALASEFVRRLAAEAVRRSNESAGEAAPLTVRTEGARGCAVLKAQDQQSDSLRIEDWAGAVAGPTYLEAHFGIPRSTLHWWQRSNDVVALRKGARKHVFPLAQFIDGRHCAGDTTSALLDRQSQAGVALADLPFTSA